MVSQPLGGGGPIAKPVRPRNLRWVALGVVVIVLVSSVAYFGVLSPSQLTTKEVIALVQPSVVAVKVSLFRGGEADGSGFVYRKAGHILTNAHLLNRAVKINVVDAAGTSHYAYLIGVDRVRDVAELVAYDMVVAGAAKALPLKDASQSIAPGANVLVVGNRFGILSNTVMSGRVGGTGRQLRVGTTSYTNLVETDAPANAGNSGGPMVNSAGELVGVVTISSSGHAYAIPVAGFAAEAQVWTRNDSGITLGPPDVIASAKSFVPGAIGAGFVVETSDPWGSNGYHIFFRKNRTGVSGEQGVTIYVIVDGNDAQAIIDYGFSSEEPASRGYAKLGLIVDLGDQASVWTTTGYNYWGVNHEVLWRDRNVVVILYWDAEYSEDVSTAQVMHMAAQLESQIGADLASYQ